MDWLSKPEPRRSSWDTDAWGEGDGGFGRASWSGGAFGQAGASANGYGGGRTAAGTSWSSGGVHSSRPSAAKAGPVKKPLASASPKAAAASVSLSLRQGDMVEHTAFGKGMVVSVRPMGGDALLEVAFDGIGTKKLMLKSAGSHMKKL